MDPSRMGGGSSQCVVLVVWNFPGEELVKDSAEAATCWAM